jgi:hypothetical protein
LQKKFNEFNDLYVRLRFAARCETTFFVPKLSDDCQSGSAAWQSAVAERIGKKKLNISGSDGGRIRWEG